MKFLKFALLILICVLLLSTASCLLDAGEVEAHTSNESTSASSTAAPSSGTSASSTTSSSLENNKKPSEEALPGIDFSKSTYVAFGDSITFGADYERSYAQMDDPYPELVAEKLNLASYENRGISGATFCENTLGRVCMTNQILSYEGNADIISVMLGVNDYAESLPLGDIGDFSKQTVYGCLNMIAEYLSTEHKGSFVFFMTPYKTTFVNDGSYTLLDVTAAIKEVAKAYDIPVLDMYTLGQYELEMYNSGSDGIHPSQSFISEYTAPQIAEFIKKNIV